MTKIAYTGPSDSYTLDAADLQKAQVEGFRKTTFPRGEAIEVSDEAASAITGGEGVFQNFPFAVVEDEGVAAKGSGKGEDPEVPDLGPGAGTDAGSTPSTGKGARGARSS